MLLTLSGCGATQTFEGTWQGSVTRTTVTTDAGQAAAETWLITSPDKSFPAKTNYDVKRTRGAESCDLKGKHGGYGGGYAMTLTSGATCTLDGVPAVLEYGNVRSINEDLQVDLRWNGIDGGAFLVEGARLKP